MINTTGGPMNKIFRDTKDWYLDKDKYASKNLIKFAVENSGEEILDQIKVFDTQPSSF